MSNHYYWRFRCDSCSSRGPDLFVYSIIRFRILLIYYYFLSLCRSRWDRVVRFRFQPIGQAELSAACVENLKMSVEIWWFMKNCSPLNFFYSVSYQLIDLSNSTLLYLDPPLTHMCRHPRILNHVPDILLYVVKLSVKWVPEDKPWWL